MLDAVVVGGGVAGLACARALGAAGARAVVLEARARLGGRVWTVRPWGDPVELGAFLVHGERASTWEAIREAGLTAVPATARQVLVAVDGEARPPWEVVEGWEGLDPEEIEGELARDGAPDRPVAEELEARGIGGWRRQLALLWFSVVWCADPARLSAAGVARVHRAWASGFENFVVVEGYDRLVEHLARDLEVRRGCPVSALLWERGRVAARTPAGEVAARAAVVTVPPTVVAGGGLGFDPPLPGKLEAARRIPLGAFLRVVARLREPPPEDAWVVALSPVPSFWRTEPGRSLISCSVGEPQARAVSALGLAGEELLRSLAGRTFPWLGPGTVAEVLVADWGADPWALGAYSYPGVGALDAPASWAEPVAGTLFFAGEATCGDRHPATVHGAYESGLRAAAQVLAALGA